MTDTYYPDLCRKLRNRRVCIQATGSLDDYGLFEEAAKAIESAVRSAQEAWKYYVENIPKWIPTSEKLPAIDEPVLLYADDNEIYIGWFSGHEEGGLLRFESDEYEWNGVVTHWMKLPEPPKEETE